MADGKVVISTELDNSGVESGTKKTKSSLNDVKKSVEKATDAVDDYADAFGDAAYESQKASRKVEDDMDGVKNSVSGVGDALKTAFSIGFIVDTVTDLMDATQELAGDLSILETNAANAGVSVDATSDAFVKLNTVSGEADSSVEAISNLLAAGIPEGGLQWAVEGLANAVTMFPDTLKIESLADSLQETLATGEATGQFGELLDRVGIGAENFTEKLSQMTTETDKQTLALQALTSGPLDGAYQAWAKTNPELVRSRDASMELQMSLAELAEQLTPIVADVTEMGVQLANWAVNNVDLRELFEIIVSGITAMGVMKVVKVVDGFISVLFGLADAEQTARVQTSLATVAFTALIYAIMQVTQAWDDMTGAEKVISILGLVTAAALTAAVAVGAFQSALTLGVAAAGIAAGIASVMLAIDRANSRVEQYERMNNLPSLATSKWANDLGIPQLATGAVIPANSPFVAMLGDQTNGRNLEAPEGLIRQIVREESGGGMSGGTLRVSAGPGFVRYLKFELEKENQRQGPTLVPGVRR